jgi:hypothetical protein
MGEVAYQLLSDQIDGRDSASVRVELPQRWLFVTPLRRFERDSR